MAKRILIFGLPGTGKTTLAEKLAATLKCPWFNADVERKRANDWDFTPEGRERQAYRMRALCEDSNAQWALVDFVCPRPEMRQIFHADVAIWMDTRKSSQYADTNKFWMSPRADEFHMRITSHEDELDFARVLDLLQQHGVPIEAALI